MKTIVLISCASKKLPVRSKAKDLYVSTLFIKNLEYSHKLNPDVIYILSAKYGLLELDTEVEPYDLTLNNMSIKEIKNWAKNLLSQLSERVDIRNDHFIILAGAKYRRYILPHLRHYEVPMEGLAIGKQLQYLSRNL